MKVDIMHALDILKKKSISALISRHLAFNSVLFIPHLKIRTVDSNPEQGRDDENEHPLRAV